MAFTVASKEDAAQGMGEHKEAPKMGNSGLIKRSGPGKSKTGTTQKGTQKTGTMPETSQKDKSEEKTVTNTSAEPEVSVTETPDEPIISAPDLDEPVITPPDDFDEPVIEPPKEAEAAVPEKAKTTPVKQTADNVKNQYVKPASKPVAAQTVRPSDKGQTSRLDKPQTIVKQAQTGQPTQQAVPGTQQPAIKPQQTVPKIVRVAPKETTQKQVVPQNAKVVRVQRKTEQPAQPVQQKKVVRVAPKKDTAGTKNVVAQKTQPAQSQSVQTKTPPQQDLASILGANKPKQATRVETIPQKKVVVIKKQTQVVRKAEPKESTRDVITKGLAKRRSDKLEHPDMDFDYNSDGFYNDTESRVPPESDFMTPQTRRRILFWTVAIILFTFFLIVYFQPGSITSLMP